MPLEVGHHHGTGLRVAQLQHVLHHVVAKGVLAQHQRVLRDALNQRALLRGGGEGRRGGERWGGQGEWRAPTTARAPSKSMQPPDCLPARSLLQSQAVPTHPPPHPPTFPPIHPHRPPTTHPSPTPSSPHLRVGGVVDAALQHAAAVAVRGNVQAVAGGGVIDELAVLGAQPLQKRGGAGRQQSALWCAPEQVRAL